MLNLLFLLFLLLFLTKHGRSRDCDAGLGLELHVVDGGAVLDEAPPGVEGDVAAGATLVSFVLNIGFWRLWDFGAGARWIFCGDCWFWLLLNLRLFNDLSWF